MTALLAVIGCGGSLEKKVLSDPGIRELYPKLTDEHVKGFVDVFRRNTSEGATDEEILSMIRLTGEKTSPLWEVAEAVEIAKGTSERWRDCSEGAVFSLKTADTKIRLVQKLMASRGINTHNSFSPERPSERTVREDGIAVMNDICYDTEYPNSFLDIYAWNDSRQHPVIFYFHGGGFFSGSKEVGDPLAAQPENGTAFSLVDELLSTGCNVVSFDYAFAPEYRIPFQLIQLERGIAFIQENQEQYGLCTDKVVLMGGSAGADISEVLALLATSESYSEKFGVKSALSPSQIACIVADEAALSLQSIPKGDNLGVITATCLGEEDFLYGKYARLLNVPRQIEDSFFPTMIVSSNVEPYFYEHGKELEDMLRNIGVPAKHFHPDKSQGDFPHGFISTMAGTHAVAREGLEQIKDFIRQCACAIPSSF